jgi:hypothetical protein
MQRISFYKNSVKLWQHASIYVILIANKELKKNVLKARKLWMGTEETCSPEGPQSGDDES